MGVKFLMAYGGALDSQDTYRSHAPRGYTGYTALCNINKINGMNMMHIHTRYGTIERNTQ